MRVLIATDAWHPQVNGVVRTLTEVAEYAGRHGAEIGFLTPDGFVSVPMPFYRNIRLALPRLGEVARRIRDFAPDVVHIATEGPIGLAARRYCRRHCIEFTTSFHTRFPDYVAARLPVSPGLVWSLLRWFHGGGNGVMAATPTLAAELTERGFRNVMSWSRGVDADLFRPRPGADLGLPRPLFLTVGRVAVEKNLEAFLSLDLPGTKVVVGDGPARLALERAYPAALFLGVREGEALAQTYAAADVFVFPSRTDTFGLVLLEALASGVPVAAYPVPGPKDVIGTAPVGVLDADLGKACRGALTLDRSACRAFAEAQSWDDCARVFVGNIRRVMNIEASSSRTGSRRLRPPNATKTRECREFRQPL